MIDRATALQELTIPGGNRREAVVDLGTCPDLNQLREALSTGQFVDSDETFRALAHFARPCRVCWGHLGTLVAGHSVIDLEALTSHAARTLDEPPVSLALGRLALASRQQDTAATLPPTHRYLLRETIWGRSFEFWWLLIKEARLVAIGSSEQQVERWLAMEDTLGRYSCEGPILDLELQLLKPSNSYPRVQTHA